MPELDSRSHLHRVAGALRQGPPQNAAHHAVETVRAFAEAVVKLDQPLAGLSGEVSGEGGFVNRIGRKRPMDLHRGNFPRTFTAISDFTHRAIIPNRNALRT